MEFLIGLIIFVADIWAIARTWTSTASTGAKVGWTLAIVFLPVIGLLLWLFLGPRNATTSMA